MITTIQNFFYKENSELSKNLQLLENTQAFAITSLFNTAQEKPLLRSLEMPTSLKAGFKEELKNRVAFLKDTVQPEIDAQFLSISSKFPPSQKLKSNHEILKRVQAFTNNLSLGKSGAFKCILDSGKSISISVQTNKQSKSLSSPYELASPNFDSKEYCVALNGIGDGSLKTPSTTKTSPTEIWKKFPSVSILNESDQRITRVTTPLFKTTLRFPILSDAKDKPQLEQKIELIVKTKLEQLADQKSKRTFAMYSVAAATVVLFGAYVLALYLKQTATSK